MIPDLDMLEQRIAELNGSGKVDRRVHLPPDVLAELLKIDRNGYNTRRHPLIRQSIARLHLDHEGSNVRLSNMMTATTRY